MKKRAKGSFIGESGQSLFEVVVAIAIVAIVLVALVNVATVSVRNTSFSRNKTIAAKIAQESSEWLRAERDSNWDTFQERAFTSTKWCLPELSWQQAKIGACNDERIPGTVFSREIRFLSIDSATMQTETVVFWEDAQGYREVKVSTLLTDWRRQ